MDKGEATVQQITRTSLFPYDLNTPTTSYSLSAKLNEVSGLAYIGSDSLAMVQDEDGIIFIFDLQASRVLKEKRFHRKGDYEGVEIVGKDAFILQSDGDIFHVANYLDEEIAWKKIENDLSLKNDTEGLGYDAVNHQLLIACKSSPDLKKKRHKGFRAIYAFDMLRDSLLPQPVTLIPLDSIKTHMHEDKISQFSRKMLEAIDDDFSFQPSAVAVHPISGELYVLASVGKMLLALDREGHIVEMHALNRKYFRQPEGLCFAPDGTLFIANEGKGGAASLLSFDYQKP